MSLIEAKKINISFSGIQILHDVDFTLEPGEINCLLGENGAGKSTLIKVLTGINSHYSGQVLVDGKLVELRSPRAAIECGIYAVQQHRDLAPSLNAVENMFLGNELYMGKSKQKLDFQKMTNIAKENIARFGIEIDLQTPVKNLKLSEQGVIAICKALIANSKILLIDEASAPLDDSERLALYEALQQLAKEGKGIVYITHHLDEVYRIGTTITILRDGRNVIKVGVDQLKKADLVHHMTGEAKLYERDASAASHITDNVAIEINGLNSKDLEDINLSVRTGEILGIAGLEGSGKDSIGRCCFGAEKITSGTIKINGKPVEPRSPIQAIISGIGLVPNDRKKAGLMLCRNIKDNITISTINKRKKRLVSDIWAEKVASKYIKQLLIKCCGSHQLIEYLSGGNQQKALIARWIETDVDVLFMIEPTEGIDIGARSDLYAVFKELAQKGKTLIVATSDIDELMTLSDRIITMYQGKIVNEYINGDSNTTKKKILEDILSAAS